MENLFIASTGLTPSVNLDYASGLFEIVGKSIPENADEFYSPVLSWMDGFIASPTSKVRMTINLEFFNISSSKRILFLMYKLNELIDKNIDVKIMWAYKENDDDMFEVGQDYAFMVNVPFEFQTVKEPVLA